MIDPGLPARRPPVPGLPGRALALAYGAFVARRNRRYDRGKGMVMLDRPVISVGNLSVGGTGKTPIVTHLVRALLDAGRRPAIAMRGYAPRHSADGSSDEASLYRDELRGVPVVAQADRVEGLLRLFATPEGEKVDCVVLDDGFQHRKLARQLDVVLVDATRDPFLDALLPAGWLREPVASLKRARWVVLTHAESVDPGSTYRLGMAVRAVDPAIRVAIARHTWKDLTIESASGRDLVGTRWLQGKKVLAVCAIGNPGPFLAAVENAVGDQPVDRIVLRDHDPYRDPTIRRIIEQARGLNAVVITNKDWMKLLREPLSSWPCPIARPNLEIKFDSGRDDLVRDAVATASSRVM
ncbi:MAG: tetraacyldisaccharide 4'-kinase [Phycisphaerales bacterium]